MYVVCMYPVADPLHLWKTTDFMDHEYIGFEYFLMAILKIEEMFSLGSTLKQIFFFLFFFL